jgi:Kelch motif
MYIFGGYVKGSKANDLWQYDVKGKEWMNLEEGNEDEGGNGDKRPT